MATDANFLQSLVPSFGGSGLIDLGITFIIGITVVILCGGFLFWQFKLRKRWNLKVEFRLPRDVAIIEREGKKEVVGSIKKEWGKGYFNAREGIVYIKRHKLAAVAMKPFNVKEALSGSNILTVIQVGIEDYRPVLEKSYLEVSDEKNNEQHALINAKIDTTESKAWKNNYERTRLNTYTISSFLREHGQVLAFGLIIIMIFIGFSIVISRIPG